MPFVSNSQRRFMYSQHPEIAKRFEEETPKGKELPEKVKKEKPKRDYEMVRKIMNKHNSK